MNQRFTMFGNLGANPELKTSGNTTYSHFSVATKESHKNKAGEWQDHTEWVDFVSFGKTAERICKTFQKGDRVYIEAIVRSKMTEKDNVKYKRTNFHVRYISGAGLIIRDSLGDGGTQSTGTTDAKAPDLDDDLPF